MHIQSLVTCEYVTSHSERDFEDVIKLYILRCANYSQSPGGDLYYHKIPGKEDAGEFTQRKRFALGSSSLRDFKMLQHWL